MHEKDAVRCMVRKLACMRASHAVHVCACACSTYRADCYSESYVDRGRLFMRELERKLETTGNRLRTNESKHRARAGVYSHAGSECVMRCRSTLWMRECELAV